MNTVRELQSERSTTWLTVRATKEWSNWMSQLARATHRSRQEVIAYCVEQYSAEHGHPAGAPPLRMPIR